MNNKQIFLISLVIAGLMVLGLFFYYYYGTPSTQRKLAETKRLDTFCMYDNQCTEGYSCYNSFECINDEKGYPVCEELGGDSKCHKECITDDDCLVDQTCQELEIWQGYYMDTKQICL